MTRAILISLAIGACLLLSIPSWAEPEISTADLLLASDAEPTGFVPSFSLGLSGLAAGSIDRTGELSRSIFGPSVFGVMAYNTSFFLRPYVEVGYLSLYSSQMDTASGPVSASLSALTLIFGPSYRRFGVRARAGVGMTQLRMRANFAGTQISTNEIDLTESFGFAAKIHEFKKYWLWVETRADFILSTGDVAASLALTIDYGGWLQLKD